MRLAWEFMDGTWQEVESRRADCARSLSAAEPVTCRFETTEGGEYRISAEVRDDARTPQPQRVYALGQRRRRASRSATCEMETVVLVPDKEDYQPGDTAKVLVQAPFTPAEGLLTVSRSGILYTERFTLDNGTATLEIPIEESYLPNVHVQVDVTGSAPRLDDKGKPVEGAPPRPAYASGSLTSTSRR